MIEAGMKAPDFALPDQNGNTVTLGDFKGKKLALYFYSRDNTPGCTRQANGFADLYEEFGKKGMAVVGVSRDSVESHKKFAEQEKLPFPILSDPDRVCIEAYGVWQERKLYGKVSMGVARTTFLIDEDGTVTKVMKRVKPDTNACDILAKL